VVPKRIRQANLAVRDVTGDQLLDEQSGDRRVHHAVTRETGRMDEV
jgi:hypothetical protein